MINAGLLSRDLEDGLGVNTIGSVSHTSFQLGTPNLEQRTSLHFLGFNRVSLPTFVPECIGIHEVVCSVPDRNVVDRSPTFCERGCNYDPCTRVYDLIVRGVIAVVKLRT